MMDDDGFMLHQCEFTIDYRKNKGAKQFCDRLREFAERYSDKDWDYLEVLPKRNPVTDNVYALQFYFKVKLKKTAKYEDLIVNKKVLKDPELLELWHWLVDEPANGVPDVLHANLENLAETLKCSTSYIRCLDNSFILKRRKNGYQMVCNFRYATPLED